MKEEKNHLDFYEIELTDDDNYFENSSELYVYYFIRDKKSKVCISEGMSVFDENFLEGQFSYMLPEEKKVHALTYLEEHVSELLSKRNINILHPYVKDLVLGSVNSTSGMYFVECPMEMSKDERELYTEENLDLIRKEVEKEGLSDYIEVGDLYMYEKRDGKLYPSYEPVIKVFKDAGTRFDLSETADLLEKTKQQTDKLPLQEQIDAAVNERKEGMPIKQISHERS